MGFCPDRQAGPLTVVNDQAQYVTETGRNMQGGRVGPNGAFEMSFVQPDGSSPIHFVGTIDRRRHGTCTPEGQLLQLRFCLAETVVQNQGLLNPNRRSITQEDRD